MAECKLAIRLVSGQQGVEWFKQAWELFKKAPFPLIAWPIVGFLGNLAFSFVPHGGLILQFLFGLTMGYGLIAIVMNLEQTGQFQLVLMMDPIKSKFFDIILFAIFTLLPLVISVVLFIGIALVSVAGHFSEYSDTIANLNADNFWHSLGVLSSLLTVGVVLPAVVLFSFAVYLMFAMQMLGPNLIVMFDATAFEAAKLSVGAVSKNVKAFTIVGVLGIVLFVAASIPLGLGLLIYFPIVTLVNYCACRAVFVSE